MKIVVDCREESLYKLIQKELEATPNIICCREQLLLGDIIFKDDNDKEIILFERKSHNDLNASLKDGRYNEQSLRLNAGDMCNHRIVYLLEESVKTNKYSKARTMAPNLLHSCIFSLLFYKGFSVLQTKSLEHTAAMLTDFARKMNKEKDKSLYSFAEPNNNAISTTEYTQTIKKVKKENITPENIDVFMLCQIPNVSSLTANVILDKYITIHDLTKTLRETPDSLASFTYINKTGKPRKLTCLVIDNIRKFLCKEQDYSQDIDMTKII